MPTLANRLASLVDAIKRTESAAPQYGDWPRRHRETLTLLAREFLPSGSGFDSGTSVDVEASTAERIVLTTSFHHMDPSGMYDGWTDHTVIVRASLVHGLSLRITGRDRDGWKDYAHEVFEQALSREVSADEFRALCARADERSLLRSATP